MNKPQPNCAACAIDINERFCMRAKGRAPEDCPSLHSRELAEAVFCDTPPDEMEFMRTAAIQEKEGYASREPYNDIIPSKPRIVEIVEFARRMAYKKLGLIFCGGLRAEADIAKQILETNGFNVVSAMCKAGKQPKSSFGLSQSQHVDVTAARESICNPAFQAALANQAGVDFNILLGLCVGHDTLAIKHLKAPITVLAVKDRLLGHSPLNALYMYHSYCSYLKKPLP